MKGRNSLETIAESSLIQLVEKRTRVSVMEKLRKIDASTLVSEVERCPCSRKSHPTLVTLSFPFDVEIYVEKIVNF